MAQRELGRCAWQKGPSLSPVAGGTKHLVVLKLIRRSQDDWDEAGQTWMGQRLGGNEETDHRGRSLWARSGSELSRQQEVLEGS